MSLIDGTVLHRFLLDVVKPCKEYGETDVKLNITPVKDKVRLVTYSVVAPNADEAMRRFFEEEAGEIIYEGDIVDRIVVGVELAK